MSDDRSNADRSPRITQRRVVLVVVVLAYILFMTFGGLADRLILFPSTDPVDPIGASREVVEWEGGELEIWAARSPGAQDGEARAFVLEFTGNATRAEWIATPAAWRWGERPVEVWAVNYPGYGGSTGPARLRSMAPSALAAFDALNERAAGRPIFLAGNSIGTAPALHVAAHRPVAGLILQNPPPMRQMILQRFGWWNLWLIAGPIAMQIPGELDSIANARQIDAPAVFLLAEADEIIPPAYQQRVVNAYGGEKRLVPLEGAYHNTPVEGEAVGELEGAMDWLLSRIDATDG